MTSLERDRPDRKPGSASAVPRPEHKARAAARANDYTEASEMSLQVTSERRKMVVDLLGAVDSKDVDGLLSYLKPEATQTFGNQEPLRGHDAIRAANVAFFETIESIQHQIIGLWESDGTVIVRIIATYGRRDGKSVTLPAVTIFRESDGLIDEYQVYFDVAPVVAPA
jgi:ketosteroid isomerase-like protein